ncbi:MAG TPA: hypothetical protein VD793_04280 [Gemmatimonadales bacterium]|nr:hypothetical protein [Gemmatimonadales bacterium]
MTGLEPLIPIALFFSVASVIILRGPMGKALAERLAGRGGDADAAQEAEAMRAELEAVRQRLEDAEQRLDFTERLLTTRRDALPGRE